MSNEPAGCAANSPWIVITTINGESAAVDKMIGQLGEKWSIVIVGDRKTPDTWAGLPLHYLSIEQQYDLYGAFAREAPHDHYCRKNFGYLYALENGADCILETDDDNIPYDSFGAGIERTVSGRHVGGEDWLNVYKLFTNRHIWPRGLPLDAIGNGGSILSPSLSADCPVQQYLADADPDVDAIYRLVFPDEAVDFDPAAKPVIVDAGTWIPFNSQNTVFFRDAFPLLYLPHHVTFRMTDIWRSLVAQRSLWLTGKPIAFHTATVRQERNAHDLLRDFEDEVPGYVNNRRIAEILSQTGTGEQGSGTGDIMEIVQRLWRSLIDEGIIPENERPLLDAWYARLSKTWTPGQNRESS